MSPERPDQVPQVVDAPLRRQPVLCALVRRVRFALGLDRLAAAGVDPETPPRDNTFAAWPSTDLLAVHGEIVVEVVGRTEPLTGYLVSVADLDDAVRRTLVPALGDAIFARPVPPLPSILRGTWRALTDRIDPQRRGIALRRVALHLGPYLSIAVHANDMQHCTIRQSFEFSAAHRLHCPEYDDARNRELFGKCNNASGHGHNYRLDVAVRVALADDGATRPGLREIESTVRRSVIDPLDHRHLNEDIPHFARVNPSVENIAAHCRDLLEAELAATGGELESLTVWETEKTGCTVQGRAASTAEAGT